MSHTTTTRPASTRRTSTTSKVETPKAEPTVKKVPDAAALKVRLTNVVTKKQPNDLHKQYVAWIEKQTGFKADLKTVQVLLASYHDFQASPEKQKAEADHKVRILEGEEKRLAAARIRLAAQAKKLGMTL